MNLKERLRADLTASMKARDETRKSTLRMVLSAITNEEVSGDTARELTDPEVVTVLAREVKKRKESAEAFAAAGRAELAEREEAESAVISEYMPQQLTDEELDEIIGAAIFDVQTATGQPPTMKQMGQVIKAAQAEAAGRADGKRISTAVKAALSQ
jgi:uncharacterized protein YqeY